jgi:hypothetical protein
MTEKKAKTATPHLRETPEQQQQIEHEGAIEDAGKDPLNSAFLSTEVLQALHAGERTLPLHELVNVARGHRRLRLSDRVLEVLLLQAASSPCAPPHPHLSAP